MKCMDGVMIHSGEPSGEPIDTASWNVLLRPGTLVYTCRLPPSPAADI